MKAFERLTLTTAAAAFKTPTCNGEGEVEVFISHFQDVAEGNNWNKQNRLLHLRECLEGKAKVYRSSESTQEIVETLKTRYGTSARQAKVRLLGL